jgi:N-acetylmuramoyl-L-alanine amidase
MGNTLTERSDEQQMEIKQNLIPENLTKTRPGLPLDLQYITIHETGNSNQGANAEAHAKLQAAGNPRTASWHYTVDDHEIWQSLPDDEVAWHAGDGSDGPGNCTSLAIEICVNEDGDFNQAKQNAIWLVCYLKGKYGIPIQKVVPHRHWSGKNCPQQILTYWDAFIKQIEDTPTVEPTPDPNPEFHRNLSYQIPMLRGEDVKRLQKRLQVQADGIFGPKTEKAVIDWQKEHSLQATGIVDKALWDQLFPGPLPMLRLSFREGSTEEPILDTVQLDLITAKVKELITQRLKSKDQLITIRIRE